MVINVPYVRWSLKGSAEAAEVCFMCGVCCAVPEYGCPAQYGSRFTPRHTYVYDCLAAERPSSNPSIWLCVSCHKCEELCPYEVSPIRFIETMKQVALEEGAAPDVATAEIEQVVNTGYAFPVTPNTARHREELGLEPIQPTGELKRIAEATGLRGPVR